MDTENMQIIDISLGCYVKQEKEESQENVA